MTFFLWKANVEYNSKFAFYLYLVFSQLEVFFNKHY